jgi:hypothetical protein
MIFDFGAMLWVLMRIAVKIRRGRKSSINATLGYAPMFIVIPSAQLA